MGETAREWRTVEKGTWPRGPWTEEPDKKQWRDAETGFACLVVRNPGGALCGYVGVEPSHPLYGVDYSTEIDLTDERRKMLERPLGNGSPMLLLLACGADEGKQRLDVLFDVHGGITFASGCQKSSDPSRGVCHVPEDGRPDDVWWFGFDCAHCDDLSPKY